MSSSLLHDQVIVITGSTRGFGYALAREALQAGAIVVVSGRSRESVQRALDGLQAVPSRVTGVPCDVSDEDQVHALADAVVAAHGRIDVWVNNAGFSAGAGRILDMSPQDALTMFRVNDLGTLHGTQAALKHMLPRGRGTLVNLYGAGSFLRPSSPTGLYAATKAWVASFTRTLAGEMEDTGIRIIGFSPGMMLTDMLTRPTVVGGEGQAMMKRYSFVLRLLAQSPEVAARKLVRILTSNQKDFREYRLFKPWTPLLGLIRMVWENLSGGGQEPELELQIREVYRWNERR